MEELFKFQSLQSVQTDQWLTLHLSFWNLGEMVQINGHTLVCSYKIYSAQSILNFFVESYLPFYIHYNWLWHWYPLYHNLLDIHIYMQLKDMLIDVLLCGLFQFMTLEQWLEYGQTLMQLCFYLLKIALLNAKEKPSYSAWVKFPVFPEWFVGSFIWN